jgi:hypothetical protein
MTRIVLDVPSGKPEGYLRGFVPLNGVVLPVKT